MRPLTRRPLDWMPQAPVQLTRSRRVAAPAARIWEAIAAHERWPEWFRPVTSVERIDGGEGVGSGRRVHIRSVTIEEEFLAWEPGRRFAFTVVRASVPGVRSMVEDIQLDPAGDDATTVRYTQAIEPVAAVVVGPLLRRAVPRTLDRALENLERHVSS